MYSTGIIIKNIFWNLTGGATAGALTFLSSIFISKNLEVSQYGVLQLATTYYLFFMPLENIVNQHVIKLEMIKKQEKSWEIACSACFILFSLYSLVSIALLTAYFIFNNSLILYTFILTVGQVFRFGLGIIYYFEVNLESHWSQISTFTGSLTSNLYKIISSYNKSIIWQCFHVMFNNVVTLFMLLFFTKKRHPQNKFKILPKSEILSLIKRSAPMVLISVLTMFVFKLDVILLGYLHKIDQISYYTNAVKFAEPWNFVATGIIAALSPNIIKVKRVSLKKYYLKIRQLIFLLTLISFAIGFFISIFAKYFIIYTYGVKYTPSIEMLQLHIWSNIFLFWMLAQQVWEINEDLKTFLIIKMSLGILLNLILNLTLIPIYGGMGCVYSSIITYLFIGFFGNFFHKKARFFSFQILKALFNKNEFLLFFKSLKNTLLSFKQKSGQP